MKSRSPKQSALRPLPWTVVLALTLAGCVDQAAIPSVEPSAPAASASTPTVESAPAPDPVAAARADLDLLVTKMESIHPDLFEGMSEADWRTAVARLDDGIPELVPDQPERLMVEFMRLAAAPGLIGGRNGHMSVSQQDPRPVLGIVTYTFADGVYVIRALPPNGDLVGGRITAVEGRPIDEVRTLLDPLIPRDNEWTPEIWFIGYFRQPEVLVGLGILDKVGPVELTLEMPDGRAETVEVGLVSPTDLAKLDPPSMAWLPADFARDIYLPERPGALWTSRMDEALWWTTLHDGATLYVQQNLFEPPPPGQLKEILVAARQSAVERVILDLRHNMGGDDDGGPLRTFRDEAIDQPGRLFVITSTNVFSATPPVVSELDRQTDAVLVGEPIGGSPRSFWAGSRSVSLDRLPIPIEVVISSQAATLDDDRLTIEPDVAVPLTGADYFGDRDAAMEAILAHKQ